MMLITSVATNSEAKDAAMMVLSIEVSAPGTRGLSGEIPEVEDQAGDGIVEAVTMMGVATGEIDIRHLQEDDMHLKYPLLTRG
jgi:hypothetical protein